jgi:hypothetical protein
MILFVVELEDAVCAEGVSTGHCDSEFLWLGCANTTLIIIEMIGDHFFVVNDRSADYLDLGPEVRFDDFLPKFAENNPSCECTEEGQQPRVHFYIKIITINSGRQLSSIQSRLINSVLS